MKKLLILLLLFAPTALAEELVISQVLYDPVLTESGGEAVELYNAGTSPVNVSGYVLKTESSAADVTLPSVVVGAGEYYLVADAGWNTSRDNMTWPSADHEEAITLGNSDAGVALLDANGSVLDAVGWGSAAEIDAGLYEGTPAVPAGTGLVLLRDGDTDDNGVDFSVTYPDFRNSQSVSEPEPQENGTAITLQVNVSNAAPTLGNISLADDSDSAGLQVIPMPGETKAVNFTVDITDGDGVSNLQQIDARVRFHDGHVENISIANKENLTNNTARYEGVFNLEFYYPSGNYTLEIDAADYGANATISLEFEVMELAAMSLDVENINFLDAALGGYSTIIGDASFGSELPTARNIGNTVLDMGVYGSDLEDGENKIAVENVEFSFSTDFEEDVTGTLSTGLQVKQVNLDAGALEFVPLAFRLFIPASTPNGAYAGAVTVVGVSG